jgi:hypothetical protein
MEQTEVTSSAGVHQPLDERLAALDDNVYGTLLGAASPADVVTRLRRAGWAARKASWLEFACAVDWCEVLLTPIEGDELTLSGVVDPDRLDDLAAALTAVGLTGHLELYAPDGRLTRTVPVTAPLGIS